MVTKNEVMWPTVDADVLALEVFQDSQELLTGPYQSLLPNLVLHSQELQPSFLAMPEEPLMGHMGEEVHSGERQWLDDESTVDIALAPEPLLQPVMLGPPTRDTFSGPFSFEVEIDAMDTNKKKYVYSCQLNRIYVLMATAFPVQFRWDWEKARRPLIVRATTVFSDEGMAEKRVERCLQHVHHTNNVSAAEACQHVLQSTRAPGTAGVHYCGVGGDPLSWYSVAVEFPARPDAGARRLAHAYAFHCKSTCSSGINRRPIEVLFTLEDFTGEVYGRQSVGARVCSCPKRDLKKDEEAAPLPPGKRRRAPAPFAAPSPAPAPPGKRVKVETQDDGDEDDDDSDIYPMTLNLQFKGRRRSEEFLTNVLTYLSAGQAVAVSDRDYDLYAKQIQQVRAQLAQLRGGR